MRGLVRRSTGLLFGGIRLDLPIGYTCLRNRWGDPLADQIGNQSLMSRGNIVAFCSNNNKLRGDISLDLIRRHSSRICFSVDQIAGLLGQIVGVGAERGRNR